VIYVDSITCIIKFVKIKSFNFYKSKNKKQKTKNKKQKTKNKKQKTKNKKLLHQRHNLSTT